MEFRYLQKMNVFIDWLIVFHNFWLIFKKNHKKVFVA